MDRAFVVKGRRVVVPRVPTYVCGSCGERFLDARAAARVERVLGVARPRTRRRAA